MLPRDVVRPAFNPRGLAVNSGLAIVGLALLLVAAVSRRLSGTLITPAIVVVAVGVLVGPLVLDDLTVSPTSATVRTLAEATLAVVLFSDSSRVDLRALPHDVSLPARLLGVGLPLTIVLGGLTASALFGAFSLSDALILGVILAPTDAGLGSAVVTDLRLPEVVRQSLNVESGLNDGICVPLLLIVLATISGAGSRSHPLHVLVEEVGYGLLSGLAAGALAAAVVIVAGGRDLIEGAWRQIIPVAAAVLAYGLAAALGGSGFIAAFVAGALFGLLCRERVAAMMHFTEESGELLDSITFLVFGFVGWFGPRGLASIVFAVIVEDAHVPQAGRSLRRVI
jgi:sodium/hydrogen antiporter